MTRQNLEGQVNLQGLRDFKLQVTDRQVWTCAAHDVWLLSVSGSIAN